MTTAIVDYQQIGKQFAPADGYVQYPDIDGYLAVYGKTFYFSKTSTLHDIFAETLYGRYHNHLGQTDQTLGIGQVNFDFKNQLSLHLNLVAQGLQAADGEFLPFNQNGFYLVYRGATTTPSSVGYSNGPYYHGHLVSWS